MKFDRVRTRSVPATPADVASTAGPGLEKAPQERRRADPTPASIDAAGTPLSPVDQPRRGLPKLRLSAALSAVGAGVPRSGADLRRLAWLPAGIVIAAAIVLMASLPKGAVESTDQTLVLMGFDPDRAQLIMALVFAVVVAGAVTFAVNRNGLGTLLGACALGAVFGQTFIVETQNAVASTGATGIFDPGGWALTLLTLVVIGVVAGWIGSTLAFVIRRSAVASGVAVLSLARARRLDYTLLRRPFALVVVLVLLAVSLPVFGDMVNFAPDAVMLRGVQGQGLVPQASLPDYGSITPRTLTPSGGSSPSVSGSAEATGTPRTTAAPGTRPWLAWKPSGLGRVKVIALPAPWVNGNTAEMVVYTPPGYDSSGVSYPVLYEAPTPLSLWGTSVETTLDYEIDTGAMPAAIVVFISEVGAPYVPSECIDTFNGTQSLETFISKTVVEYVDGHYRTMQDARARAIMGFSEGGFCAAMLALRHTDVFNVAIAFSGYFVAGSAGSNSKHPYLDQADIDAHSPALLAQQLPSSDRPKMYFIVVARDGTDFMGSQAGYFDKILKVGGYSFLAVNSVYPHGWTEVRLETPGVLEAWGRQLVRSGIW